MTFVYDWNEDGFTSLPVGVQVTKPTRIGGRAVQFLASYERNFHDEGFGPEDAFGFTIKLLVPQGG